MTGNARVFVPAAIVAFGLAAAVGLTAQSPEESTLRRISVTWTDAPIRDVLRAFAAFSGRSIVPGASVTGRVTADINDQRWDVALAAIIASQGLIATEDEYGIIRVGDMRVTNDQEGIEPVVTRVYRLSFTKASELQATIEPLLSDRGSVRVMESTNSLVVTDIARVQRAVGGLIGP